MSEGPHRTELHPLEAAARQRQVLLRILRMGFLVLMLTVALLATVSVNPNVEGLSQLVVRDMWWVPFLSSVALVGLFVTADLLTPRKKISTLSGVFFGMLAGILASVAVSFIIDLFAKVWAFEGETNIISTTKVLLGMALCYLGISTVLQTQDEFRLVIPYVEFSKQVRGPQPLVLDTSALIDARIVDLADTGIIQSPMVVPRFVIAELQALSDSQDRLKRAKGRRGLDVIAKLQRASGVNLSIDETPISGVGVDQMLVELAKRMPASLVTADMALNRVAGIQGVRVLNLNDVANAVKPAVIPGEQISIKLIKPGEQRGQAVGYLDDGTMVVAEDGGDRIGQRVSLSVTSTLQTSAGRLIFGRIADAAGAVRPGPVVDAPGAPEQDHSPAAETTAEAAPQDAHEPDAAGGPFPPRKAGKPNPARNPRR